MPAKRLTQIDKREKFPAHMYVLLQMGVKLLLRLHHALPCLLCLLRLVGAVQIRSLQLGKINELL